ncbi:rpb8 (nucleomorph) [Hemiselmis andersenii]|uniref:DNA-directed RNA polymerases I, II, and III subunit RPABC3 n=1 Tax=Hemiselmis andersenii TaxID=464988 RepID=A9BKX8_HEMAN|nr:rpb8 [Hemiselmis andersenii]ABW98133.1 rpb8 [Hemiselmis andersenii]|mmetsp:Transcript_27717/g.67568  ORF Transcript_27717/g.67568 Transcript_27717/m.67568 type:complete len:156 (+) Transcript_27717:1782-2249(+)
MELLNEKLVVKEIDMISTKINNKWIKVKNKIFSKVSRIFAISIGNKIEVTLDINTEIYPIHDQDKLDFRIMEVNPNQKNEPNNHKNWIDFFDRKLIELFEYVMYGTIFHCGIENKKFFFYGSFGGLLLKIFGNSDQIAYKDLKVDSKILLLIRKI